MIKKFAILSTCLMAMSSAPASARDILITDYKFDNYVKDAKPGDVFTIAPGTYKLRRAVPLTANGTKDAPITIRPSETGDVILEIDSLIGFKVTGSNWIVENLDFHGVCEYHSKCEHALQIAGNADNTIVRNNNFIDFNSAIKGNGQITDGRQYFPDHVLIENNKIYNRKPRETGNPVTPIDVVGGRYWIIRDNFIADFQKTRSNKVSYAAFLKGNSDNGLFERNLVICEWKLKGGVRVGLSLGGGGTGDPDYCQGRSCKIEHYKGVIRSNVIMNCPVDVGIYLNNAANTKILNNTILNTAGIDVRFNGSFATIANNVIEGRIKARDDGRFRELGNLVKEDLSAEFPNAANFDLTPSNLALLKQAVRDFEAVDYCTGAPQEDWIGATAQPPACSVKDQLKALDTPR